MESDAGLITAFGIRAYQEGYVFQMTRARKKTDPLLRVSSCFAAL